MSTTTTQEPPKAAVELVEGFEGYSTTPYLCPAGVWTIGCGSTRGLNGLPVTAGTPPVSRDEAAKLVQRDLQGAAACVAQKVSVPLTENQRAALCSFVYNVGAGAFGSSTLLKKLNAGDYAGAAAQFDAWVYGAGKVLPGLKVRRAAERKLFETT